MFTIEGFRLIDDDECCVTLRDAAGAKVTALFDPHDCDSRRFLIEVGLHDSADGVRVFQMGDVEYDSRSDAILNCLDGKVPPWTDMANADAIIACLEDALWIREQLVGFGITVR